MAQTTFDPTTLAAEISDDAVVFIGRGKSHSMVHLIEGAAKAKRETYSACGQSVKNTGRQPIATDTVCKKCQCEPSVEPTPSTIGSRLFPEPEMLDCGHRNDAAHAFVAGPGRPCRPTVDPIVAVFAAAVESSPTDAETAEIVERVAAVAGDVVEPIGFTLNAAEIEPTGDALLIVVDEADGEIVDATATLVVPCYHCGADGADKTDMIDGDVVMVHAACYARTTATSTAPRSTAALVTKADGTPKWRVKKPCAVCGVVLKVKRGTENPTHKACRA